MTLAFRSLDEAGLLALAEKLDRDPSLFPPVVADVYNLVAGRSEREALVTTFAEMAARGMNAAASAWVLRTIVTERRAQKQAAPKVIPVWSGLDMEGLSHKASVVIRDLFREAKTRVWISTFSIDKREKLKAFFGELATRHDRGELAVRLYVNIKRDRDRDEGKSDEYVINKYRDWFVYMVWPGRKLPEVYYDPRSLDIDKKALSCLHAKSVMVDNRKVLITSANFSEAAQIRNIEAGVVIEDELVAETYCRNFQRLVEKGLLVRLVFEGEK